MVAALEHEQLRASGGLRRRRDRHQAGLRARVREADAVEAEALAQQARELGFVRMQAADAREPGQRIVRGVEHAPLAVAEEPGGVVAEQVNVLVAVGVNEHRALAPDEGQGERLVVEHGTRVPAGQHLCRLGVEPPALRAPVGELAARPLE